MKNHAWRAEKQLVRDRSKGRHQRKDPMNQKRKSREWRGSERTQVRVLLATEQFERLAS